jgi:hypothetical protein
VFKEDLYISIPFPWLVKRGDLRTITRNDASIDAVHYSIFKPLIQWE